MFDERRNPNALEGLLSPVHPSDRLTASKWFGHIEPGDLPSSSNVEAQDLPFQRWYRFKEAFSPRFVSSAIASLSKRPARCIDPFGGSGTTALASQFVGVLPTTIEVNPFLADLIEAKLCQYDVRLLARDFAKVVDRSRELKVTPAKLLSAAPATFVEPGVDDRWIFDRSVAKRLLAYREAIASLDSCENRRLFRVLLGSIAVKLSNVVISGKGRRYRSGWESRTATPKIVERAFADVVQNAIQDITRFGRRAESRYTLLRGDSRTLVTTIPETQFSLFSPPYPNSFDYTDIYNVELWLLGYLSSPGDNRSLRESTLRSHVQIKRSYAGEAPPSLILERTLKSLRRQAEKLWDPDLPNMVRAYFSDMAAILKGLEKTMAPRADVMMVIGDSRYAGVRVDVASIFAEMSSEIGFKTVASRPIRAMRASAQQGGRHELSEALLHLRKKR
jgi:hypothetical protein